MKKDELIEIARNISVEVVDKNQEKISKRV